MKIRRRRLLGEIAGEYDRKQMVTAWPTMVGPAALRVLRKCGFVVIGEDRFTGRDGQPGEEFVLRLG